MARPLPVSLQGIRLLHHGDTTLVATGMPAVQVERPGSLRLIDPGMGIAGEHGMALVRTDAESRRREQRLIVAGSKGGGFVLLHQSALSAAFLSAADLQCIRDERTVRSHDERHIVSACSHPARKRLDSITLIDPYTAVSRVVLKGNRGGNHTRLEGGRCLILISYGAGFCRMFGAETRRHHHGRMPVILRTERPGHVLRHIHLLAALIVQADAACRSSAAFRISGNCFPRFEALRRIPRQAFGLK